MDNQKVAFIICANMDYYYNECIRYIQELEVPEGYSVDVLCIQEADSMTAGYQEAMQSCDAKYKVYLHQDVFILNTNFISDMLNIFKQDEKIGMLGILGTDKMPIPVSVSYGWNLGRIREFTGASCIEHIYRDSSESDYIKAEAIAGCLMATQYDVPWREDLLSGWEYYDLSQSLEMKRAGYEVVVASQGFSWCHHDGGLGEVRHSERDRDAVLDEYTAQVCVGKTDGIAPREKEGLREKLITLFNNHLFDELVRVAPDVQALNLQDMQIRALMVLMEIYAVEQEDGRDSILFHAENWELAYEYYQWIRFMLLRMEFGKQDERKEDLKAILESGEISDDVVRKLSAVTLKETSNVYRELIRKDREWPLVSVVVLVYNGEEVIRDTIDSILGQTYENMEVIIIDDGSADNSRKIISAYEDPRIKAVYLDKNCGVCSAGNIGFEKSAGKYVALIGHDDVWHKEKLEKQVEFLEEHPSCGVCFTWVDIIDEDNNIINEKWEELSSRFCSYNSGRNEWARKIYLEGNYFCAPSACIRRHCLEKTGYYRYGLVQLQDYDLWLRILREAFIYVLPERLTFYRRFQKSEKNLSSVNIKTQNRDDHEIQWIQSSFLKALTEKQFKEMFYWEMRRKEAAGEKEILCEKVFLLWGLKNCFAVEWFIELLEDQEYRRIFEEKYGFSVKDFYELNTQSILFDRELLWKIKLLGA